MSTMDWRERIESRPEVLGGKPVIRGTRIPVALILERLGDGWSEQELIESWPRIAPEDVRAAQAYAASARSSDEISPPDWASRLRDLPTVSST